MQKCINGAIWSKTSSAISRHSDASQLATKRPIPALLDSLIWSRFSLPAGDCKQALVHAHVGLLQPIHQRFLLGGDLCGKRRRDSFVEREQLVDRHCIKVALLHESFHGLLSSW